MFIASTYNPIARLHLYIYCFFFLFQVSLLLKLLNLVNTFISGKFFILIRKSKYYINSLHLYLILFLIQEPVLLY